MRTEYIDGEKFVSVNDLRAGLNRVILITSLAGLAGHVEPLAANGACTLASRLDKTLEDL